MALIQANRCLLQIELDGNYVTVACLRSFRVNTTTTEKEITAPEDGKFKNYDYHQLSARISVDGVLIRDPTTNTMFSFAQAQLNFLELNMRVVFIAENGLPMAFEAQCIVADSNFEASAGQVASGTAELLANGYTLKDVLEQFVNLRILLFGNPSIQAFFKMQLIDTTGTAIFQTDVLPQANGGNLANPLDITVPVPKGNWYYWFQMNTNSLGNVFTLDATPTKTSVFNNGIYNETSNGVQLYDFNQDREVSVGIGITNPPPTCVAPLVASFSLPDGMVAIAWTGGVSITGTGPFSISNVTKPAWMNIAVNGNTINLSGTPTTSGSGQVVQFDITNACGTVTFGEFLTINSNPGIITVNWDFSETGPNTSSGLVIFKNGVQIVGQATTATGSIQANALDLFEVRVVGQALVNKEIHVIASVDGEIASDFTSGQMASVTFGVSTGQTYQINATATS